MRKRLYSILNYFIFLGGGIFLVWWQLKEMTPEDVKEFNNAFSYANYWLIIPIVCMALMSHLARSLRWKLLMEPLDYNPSLKNVFAVTMVGYLANSAVPRLGEILKCTFLSRYEKMKVDKLVGTILVERMFDLVCFFIFIGVTILIQIDLIGGYVKDKLFRAEHAPGMPIWLKLLIITGGITLLVILFKTILARFPGNKAIIRIKNFFVGIGMGFVAIKSVRHKKRFIFYTLLLWSMYLLQIYVGFMAMSSTSLLGIKAACSVLTLATLAMIVTPGGIGSFPLFVMETLLIYHIPSPQGKAFGWLIWGVATGINITAGFISLLILPYINRKKHEISEQHPG
jgi:uncharacterized protein (TIRG00374 family)